MLFPTLADDAKPFAQEAAQRLRDRGFTIRESLTNAKLQHAPTFFATRQHELVICEVALTVDIPRLWAFRSFAKSRRSDTRVEVLLLPNARFKASARETLKTWGFGLARLANNHEQEEVLKALDQTLKPDLPPLTEFPAKHRARLGKSYDYFGDAEWISGFDTACAVLEQLAQKHLLLGLNTGRITFVRTNGTSFSLTKQKIKKLTLGQLGDHFDMILSKTIADSEIGNVLKAVNPARREVAHRKGTPTADRIVRRSVEDNMWRILTALRHCG